MAYKPFPPPATYFGDHVLVVAPPGQGSRFASIQAAIDYAEAVIPVGEAVGILLAPGYYDEDVILRRDNVHFNGLAGGLGGVMVKSLTVSDCTPASIALFNASGNPAVLVEDATGNRQHGIPETNQYDPLPANVTISPTVGAITHNNLGFRIQSARQLAPIAGDGSLGVGPNSFTSAGAYTFQGNEGGWIIRISGSLLGNDGDYTITGFVGAPPTGTVTINPAPPGGPEGGLTWALYHPENLTQIGGGTFQFEYLDGISNVTTLIAAVAGDPLATTLYTVTGDVPATFFPEGYSYDFVLYTGTKVKTFSMTNIRPARRSNVPAWFAGSGWNPGAGQYNLDSAIYSLRFLGAPVPGNTFLRDVGALISMAFETADGAHPGAPTGVYACNANSPVFLCSVIGEGAVLRNCGSCLSLWSGCFAPAVSDYDATLPEPADNSRQGFGSIKGAYLGGLYATGPDGNNGMVFGTEIMGELKTEATSAQAYTTLVNSAVFGSITIVNLGPSIAMMMGRYMAPCGGAGAAGFSETVGFGT